MIYIVGGTGLFLGLIVYLTYAIIKKPENESNSRKI
ncbi:hypothetical protein ABG775_10415 [Peribacillus simplex]